MKRCALLLICVAVSLAFTLDAWGGGRHGAQSFSRGSSGFKGHFRGKGFGVNHNFSTTTHRGSRFKGNSRGQRFQMNRNSNRRVRGGLQFNTQTPQQNRFKSSSHAGFEIQARQQATLHNHLSRAFPNQTRNGLNPDRFRTNQLQGGRQVIRQGNAFRTTGRLRSGTIQQPFGFVSPVAPVVIGRTVVDNSIQVPGFGAVNLQRRTQQRFFEQGRQSYGGVGSQSKMKKNLKKKRHRHLRRMKNGKQVFSDFGGRAVYQR